MRPLPVLLVITAILGVLTTAAWADDEFRVTVRAANIRQQPTTDSPVITSVPMDTRLPVLAHTGRWLKVEVVDRKGATTTGFIFEPLGKIETSGDTASSGAQPSNTSPVETPAVPEPPATPPAPPIVRAEQRQPEPARPVAAPTPAREMSQAQRGFLLEGGIVASGGNVGTILGAGGFIFPFDNDEIAIQVDGHFRQANSVGGFYGSGNVVQYFHIPNLPFTPFAGAGIPVMRSGGATRVGAQVIFGFDGVPMGHFAVGGQLRTSFVSGGPETILLAHISFNSNRPKPGAP
jgi:hypothetical protein